VNLTDVSAITLFYLNVTYILVLRLKAIADHENLIILHKSKPIEVGAVMEKLRKPVF